MSAIHHRRVEISDDVETVPLLTTTEITAEPIPVIINRTGTVSSTVFNLVSTILGGGILSMPYAFAKSGYALAMIILVTTAILSGTALFLLRTARDLAAQKGTIVKNYEDLARFAYGHRAERATTLILFLLTFLVSIAYLILIADQIQPAATLLCGNNCFLHSRSIIQILVIAFVFPLCLIRTLTALRFTSFGGVLCVVYVSIAVAIRSFDFLSSKESLPEHIRPEAFHFDTSIFLSVSVMSLSFVCHFNFLPSFRELKSQSDSNVRTIVWCTMGIALALYGLAGFAGYMEFGSSVSDDVLKEFSIHDTLIVIGRISVAFTLILSYPLNVNPCRAALDRLLFPNGHLVLSGMSDMSDFALLFPPDGDTKASDTRSRAGSWSSVVEFLHTSPRRFTLQMIYVVETVGILAVALLGAIAIPNVSLVWTFYGATVSVLIVFILPPLFVLKITKNITQQAYNDETNSGDGHGVPNRVLRYARFLVVTGFVLMVLCTAEAVRNVQSGNA